MQDVLKFEQTDSLRRQLLHQKTMCESLKKVCFDRYCAALHQSTVGALSQEQLDSIVEYHCLEGRLLTVNAALALC